jgi:hypothetical protein
LIFTGDEEQDDDDDEEEERNNHDTKQINDNNVVNSSIDSNRNAVNDDVYEEGEENVDLGENFETVVPSTRTEELLTSANAQQRFLANFFKQYLAALMRYEDSRRRFKHASKPLPFHIVVNGLAGSGKSYVISIIKQMLTDFCISESAVRNRPRRRKGLLKMAHTGKAALNILGWTIHTALGMVKF